MGALREMAVRYRRLAVTMLVMAAVVSAAVWGLAAVLAPALLRQGQAEFRHALHSRPEVIRLGHGAPNGSFVEIARALKARIDAEGEYHLELIRTAGATHNAELLKADQIDVGFLNSAVDYGQPEFVGLASVESQYVHVIVPVTSPARRIVDLTGTGADWNLGRDGGRDVALAVADYFRVPSERRVGQVAPTLLQDFDAGRMQAAMRNQALHSDNVTEALASGRYRLLAIDEASALAEYIPGSFATVIPRGAYGADRSIPPGDLPTLGTRTLLVARASLRYELARAVTSTLFDPAVLRAARLTKLMEADARSISGLPLHQAAADYYGRADPLTSKGFSVISLILALFGFAAKFSGVAGRRLREGFEASRRPLPIAQRAERASSVTPGEMAKEPLDVDVDCG